MHCIDFVTRCPLHDCKLFSDDECSSLEQMLSSGGTTHAARNAIRYAQVARGLAFDCPRPVVRESIHQRLVEKGYVSESGRFQLAELRQAFAKLFSDGFEDVRLNDLLKNSDVAETCARLLNRAGRAAHPVYLILLQWLSFEVGALPKAPRRNDARTSGYRPPPDEVKLKRDDWLRHQDECAGLGRTEIRRRQPAIWKWLYRNDRNWLVRHQVVRRPTGSKKSRATPSPAFTRVVLSNESPLGCSATGLVPLPSAYQTRLAYGMSDYLFSRAAEAFNGVGKSAQLPARNEVFVARRLDRAVLELVASDSAQNIAAVARQARLRISTVLRYEQNGGREK